MKTINRNLLSALCILVMCVNLSCSENELFELSPNVEESNLSYEKQFKAIWTAIDLNYPIWDYERDEYGLNWDDIYDEFLPKFREQDSRFKETGDTACWLSVQGLYHSLFGKLHDGHINFKIKDVYTGKKANLVNALDTIRALSYYFSYLIQTIKFGYYQNDSTSQYFLKEIKSSSDKLYQFGHFQGDIIYLHFHHFEMSTLLAKEDRTAEEQSRVGVWKTWFERIQNLHNNGKLKGVILDVRCNPGGIANDYQYFLGALHGDIDGSGGVQTGYRRMKNGIGRYDYKYEYTYTYHPYVKEHVNVTAPIVVLADSMSASMAEQTCLAAKKISNAYVIGTQTFGALSSLAGDEDVNKDSHFTKFGHIGDPTLSTSSFYIKMPYVAFVTYDGKIIEGKGVEPDEFVIDNDVNRDKQLEFALDYINKLNK